MENIFKNPVGTLIESRPIRKLMKWFLFG